MNRSKAQFREKPSHRSLNVDQAAKLAVQMLKEEAHRYMLIHDPIYREMCGEMDRESTKRP